MTDHSTQGGAVDSGGDPAVGAGSGPHESEGVACTEAYEQDGVVVLYDAENPLAWIEADSAVDVQGMA